jgi:hypothetical protein
LANQGIRLGSDAYTRAQGDFGQQTNDARLATIAQAGQEQSRLAGLANQQFGNQMSLQGFNDQRALTERNQPLNELGALQSGGQITQPNFMSASGPQMAGTDVAGLMGAQYQNQLGAWQQRQQSQNQLLGGVMGLGANLMLSDRRAKKDIRKVGELKGLPLYEYRYKGEGRADPKSIGVMADEAQKANPRAVVTGDDGLKKVNYATLFSVGGSK